MRLSLLVLLLVGVALVAGQVHVEDRRQRARARFLELASKARSGDRAAQEELQARRRNRTRQPTPFSESPAPVPQRPVPIEQPEISRHRSTVRQNPTPTPVFRENRPAPQPQPVRTVRTRGPVRRTRIRLPRPVAPIPTTFRPAVFPPSLAPVPVFAETNAPPDLEVNPVTELPVIDIFPTEPATEESLPMLEHTPAPAEVTHRFEVQPEQVFIQPQLQHLRPSVQRIQRPRPAIKRTERPREVIRRTQESQRSTFDFEPHRALNQGLEVGSRAEHIVSRVNSEKNTEPPVETIRRYSYFDEQGNYIFGYEASDGSFKEEKRGLDCIVTGKYGYVDPDGIRREFSYISGNQCDPNAVVDENQEVLPLPLNDQFLQQTVEQQLTEEELNQINFNRHRQPVSKNPIQQTFIRSSRHRRPQTRLPVETRQRQQQPQPKQRRQQQPQPEQRRQQQPQLEQHQPHQQQPHLEQQQLQPEQHQQQPHLEQQQPQPEQHQQHSSPIPVTPAPFPLFTFTTPPSFNRFPTPTSLRRPPQLKKRPQSQQPEQLQVQVVRTTTPLPVVARPTQSQVLPRPTHPPQPQPKSQPKPIAFDFNQEFGNIFSHFNIPTTRRPFFRAPTQAFRPTPAPTRLPPPPSPTPRPTPPPPPPPPVTSAPALIQPPRNEGFTSLGAAQLVFDARTGSFKTIRNPVRTGVFNHQPVQNPPAGQPLPLTVGPTGPSPLPRVPLGGLVINSPGSSPSTDEFDKFFSQFNLQF